MSVRPVTLAREVIRARRFLSLSQVQFARLFGVHPITVSKWETGKAVPNPWQVQGVRFCYASRRFGKIKRREVREAIESHGGLVVFARIVIAGRSWMER